VVFEIGEHAHEFERRIGAVLRLVDDHDQLALCARELEKKIIQAFMHAHDVPAGINDAEFVLWGRFS
jgi:hypothetical protein